MKDTLHGDAHTNMTFEVDAIQYSKNEIIHGCKIIKKEQNGIIHAKSEHAGIQINTPANMSIFNEGETVPVVVKMVRYNVNQTAISVLAIPFIPVVEPTIYYNINGKLTQHEKNSIKHIMTQISEEEKNIKQMKYDSKVYKFFIEMLSNKNNKLDKAILQSYNKIIDINNIFEISNGVIFQDTSDFGTFSIYHIENKDVKPEIIDEKPFIAFSAILLKQLSDLQTIVDFMRHYPTFSDVSKYKHIWKLYTSHKK